MQVPAQPPNKNEKTTQDRPPGCEDDVKLPCLLQYMLFPPLGRQGGASSTGTSGIEPPSPSMPSLGADLSLPNTPTHSLQTATGDTSGGLFAVSPNHVRIATELWVEPQEGQLCDLPGELKHLSGLSFDQVADEVMFGLLMAWVLLLVFIIWPVELRRISVESKERLPIDRFSRRSMHGRTPLQCNISECHQYHQNLTRNENQLAFDQSARSRRPCMGIVGDVQEIYMGLSKVKRKAQMHFRSILSRGRHGMTKNNDARLQVAETVTPLQHSSRHSVYTSEENGAKVSSGKFETLVLYTVVV